MIADGADVLQMTNDFVWYLRTVLLAGSGASEDALEISAERYQLVYLTCHDSRAFVKGETA